MKNLNVKPTYSMTFFQVIKLISLLFFFAFSFFVLFIVFDTSQKAILMTERLNTQLSFYQHLKENDTVKMSLKIAGYDAQFHFFEEASVFDITFPHLPSFLCQKMMRKMASIPVEILVNGQQIIDPMSDMCLNGLFVEMTFQISAPFSKNPLTPECASDSECGDKICFHRFCLPKDKALSN